MTRSPQTLLSIVILSAFVFAGAASLRADDGAAAASSANTNLPPPHAPYEKLTELPPGNHKLLETMTKNFGLTLDQQLVIEPLLHDEESVSKPILGFAAFTPEEKQAMLLTIKHAARRQIRTLLTPEQQQKLDEEDASLAAKAAGGSGQKKGGGKKAPAVSTEESLISAITKYQALWPAEKETMIAQVKKAAQRPAVAPEAAPAAVTNTPPPQP